MAGTHYLFLNMAENHGCWDLVQPVSLWNCFMLGEVEGLTRGSRYQPSHMFAGSEEL